MKTLQTHFLQLSIDGLNHRAMLTDQTCIGLAIAAHIATVLRDQTHLTRNIGQQLVFLTDIAFVRHDLTAGGKSASKS